MKNTNGNTRVTVEFSSELYDDLENLEKKKSLTKAALLRNALKLQKLLFDVIDSGNEIIIHDPKTGKEKQLLLM